MYIGWSVNRIKRMTSVTKKREKIKGTKALARVWIIFKRIQNWFKLSTELLHSEQIKKPVGACDERIVILKRNLVHSKKCTGETFFVLQNTKCEMLHVTKKISSHFVKNVKFIIL